MTNARALGTWLSYDDLVQLVERAIDTPVMAGEARVGGCRPIEHVTVDRTLPRRTTCIPNGLDRFLLPESVGYG